MNTLEKSPWAISCGVYFITIDHAGTNGSLRATNLNRNGLLCGEKNTKAGDEVIQRCQLAVACYLPSIHTHSSSAFNKLLSVVWGWRDRVKWWKRRERTQIRGFPSPRTESQQENFSWSWREWVIPSEGVQSVQRVHTFYWCCSDSKTDNNVEEIYSIRAQYVWSTTDLNVSQQWV